MKTQTKIAAALVTMLSSGIAGAAGFPMYINLGSNAYDLPAVPFGGDPDFTTATFTEFGFNQFLATSLYEKDGSGNLTGNIIDTNKNLGSYGIPTGGLVLPTLAQMSIGNLSPLTPPNNPTGPIEGFGLTWTLRAEYYLTGSLGGSGPSFTNGTYDIFFDDLSDGFNPGALGSNDRRVLGLTLTSSLLQVANLDLNFNITFAETGFLFLDTGYGFVDAATSTALNPLKMVLDTNVNPPLPDIPSLVNVTKDGVTYGARQTTLDGSISGKAPEPESLALIGIGLLGLAATRKRKPA